MPVAQPEKVRSPEFLVPLSALAPDLAIVVAFGQIFPVKLLALPRWGCMNLHASLLPKYRGAAPIQAAIAAGDRETGVTTMKMEKALDAGPVLLRRSLTIGERETAGELFPRLAQIGAELVLETLSGLERGTLFEQQQDNALATYAPMIEKRDGRIDWRLPASRLVDRLRAFTPWPGVFAELHGEAVKVLAAEVVESSVAADPGRILSVGRGRLCVACGDGTALAIERAQRPGRSVVTGTDLANGLRLAADEVLP